MKFWDAHDLMLLNLRKKAICLIEEFEGKNNINDKNYYRRLHRLLDRKLGKHARLLTGLSVAYTLRNMKSS